MQSYKEKLTLAGVIYMHRISDIRMSGTSRRNFKMFRKLCGENALKNVVIVTTMWGKVDMEEGETRERDLQNNNSSFKAVLAKGAQMVRHERPEDVDSAHEILRLIVRNHPLPLQIQQELVDRQAQLAETSAGEEVQRELVTKKEKHEYKRRTIYQELQGTIFVLQYSSFSIDNGYHFAEVGDKDRETRQELEVELEETEKEIVDVDVAMVKLNDPNLLWYLACAVGAVLPVAILSLIRILRESKNKKE
jgi:hypothetical protein